MSVERAKPCSGEKKKSKTRAGGSSVALGVSDSHWGGTAYGKATFQDLFPRQGILTDIMRSGERSRKNDSECSSKKREQDLRTKQKEPGPKILVQPASIRGLEYAKLAKTPREGKTPRSARCRDTLGYGSVGLKKEQNAVGNKTTNPFSETEKIWKGVK